MRLSEFLPCLGVICEPFQNDVQVARTVLACGDGRAIQLGEGLWKLAEDHRPVSRPSMTLARTPSRMLLVRGVSFCCETASKDSSSGMPDCDNDANCRVTSASSAGETPRRNEKLRCRRASFCATSVTLTGSRSRSRNCCRTCFAVSPSSSPLDCLPAWSIATYSNAPKSYPSHGANLHG